MLGKTPRFWDKVVECTLGYYNVKGIAFLKYVNNMFIYKKKA